MKENKVNKIVLDLVKEVEEASGFNFLEKKRASNHVEARAVLFYILVKQRNFTTQYASDEINKLGYYYNRTSILHSNKEFSVYYKYSEFCQNVYYKVNKSAWYGDRVNSELELYVRNLPMHKHKEVLEKIKWQEPVKEFTFSDSTKEYVSF